jgi:N-acetylglutamate synthase/N-acetylornithine aminotransferase
MPAASDSFSLARGFSAAATACGLKASGNLDLALVAAEQPCAAAGVFAQSREGGSGAVR